LLQMEGQCSTARRECSTHRPQKKTLLYDPHSCPTMHLPITPASASFAAPLPRMTPRSLASSIAPSTAPCPTTRCSRTADRWCNLCWRAHTTDPAVWAHNDILATHGRMSGRAIIKKTARSLRGDIIPPADPAGLLSAALRGLPGRRMNLAASRSSLADSPRHNRVGNHSSQAQCRRTRRSESLDGRVLLSLLQRPVGVMVVQVQNAIPLTTSTATLDLTTSWMLLPRLPPASLTPLSPLALLLWPLALSDRLLALRGWPSARMLMRSLVWPAVPVRQRLRMILSPQWLPSLVHMRLRHCMAGCPCCRLWRCLAGSLCFRLWRCLAGCLCCRLWRCLAGCLRRRLWRCLTVCLRP
jgi:hypothetical protein